MLRPMAELPAPGELFEFDPKIAEEAFRGTFPGHLGIEITELEADRVVGRMVVDQRHLHPGQYVHGGVWVAFADTVAAWRTMRNLRPGWNFTTAELKVNVLAAGRSGDEFIGTGVPLHVGKRTQVWEVRVTRGEQLCANFICTQMCLEPKN